MKANLIRRMAIAYLPAILYKHLFLSKSNSAASQDTSTANLTTTADDQQQVSTESDIITNDANTALNGQSVFSGDNSSTASVSGTTEVNSTNADMGILRSSMFIS